MNQEQVKKQLRQMFKLAESDTACDGEIESALQAAKNLMSAYQITRDDVFEGDDGEVNIGNVSYDRAHRYSRYSYICPWESYTCHFIRDFVSGVQYYVDRGQLRRNKAGMATEGKATRITFYGPQQDVQFALELFDELVTVITAAATLRYGDALAKGDASAYAEGFARGVYEANKKEVEKLEHQAQESESSSGASGDNFALTVVNRALALCDGGKEWLEKEHGVKLSSGRGSKSRKGRNRGAFAQGKSDGKNYKTSSKKRAGYLDN